MKRKIALVTGFLFFVIMIGCSNDKGSPDIEGYVFEVDKERILVVEDVSSSQFESLKGKSIKQIKKEHELIYVYYSRGSYNVGDQIQVWTNNIDSSEIPQTDPSKLKKVDQ